MSGTQIFILCIWVGVGLLAAWNVRAARRSHRQQRELDEKMKRYRENDGR